jgi:hypothetical protein
MSETKPRISFDDRVDAILPLAGSVAAFFVLMVLLAV